MDDALATLSRFERFAFRAMRWLSHSWIGYVWQRYVLIPFVALFVSRRLYATGLERVHQSPTDMLLSNQLCKFLGAPFTRQRGIAHE